MKKHHPMIDVDDYGTDMEPHEMLEWIELHVQRVIGMFGSFLGNAVIKRSCQGFHVKFTGELTEDQIRMLYLQLPFGDTGYKWWFWHKGEATLRIKDKVIVKEVNKKRVGRRIIMDMPQIVRVIEA